MATRDRNLGKDIELFDKLGRYERALKYIWDRCGPHDEFPPCRDAAERAQKALESR